MFLLGALLVLGFQESITYFLPMLNNKGLFYYLCVYLTTGFILGRLTRSHTELYSRIEKEEEEEKEKEFNIKSHSIKRSPTIKGV